MAGGGVGGVAPPMFPSRALERGVTRAARSELGATLLVAEQTESAPGLTELTDGAAEHALLLMLEGPDGAQGLAVASPDLVALVLALRMTGTAPATPPEARAPTRIDADMLGDWLDRLLSEFAAPLAGQPSARWSQGFHSGDRLSDPRLVRFSLPDQAYRAYDLRLELPACSGALTLRLVLPAEPAHPIAEDGGDAADKAGEHATHVLGATVAIDAVLTRLKVPLEAVADWQPGTLLPFAASAIDEVRLEMPGRVLVASGRLGQARGDRAVRLSGDATQDLQPLRVQGAGNEAAG